MKEIGALSPGETVSPDDSADVLYKLQRLLDRFNAREPLIYSVSFSVFDLPGPKQPYLIGPTSPSLSPDFSVNQRPVKIYSCSLILVNTTPSQVEIPVYIRDEQWWADNRVKNLESFRDSNLPTIDMGSTISHQRKHPMQQT